MTLFDRLAVAGLAVAAAVAALSGWLLLIAAPADPPLVGPSASVAPLAPAIVVVDVEGAVVFPGLHELTAGARVADALTAAGGYSPEADLAAAAAALNLAAPVTDGQQIVVPVIGQAAGGNAGAGSGLVNLNTADGAALDALPGIGPVTVGKILAARAERPFATLDELVTRKVLTASQLEKVRELVTVP